MSDKDLDRYLQESTSWDADRAARASRSARVAWMIAGLAMFCALTSSAAIALLTPLKRVDPFVIRVDNTTGIIDVVPQYAGAQNYGEPVTRYLLNHYVTVCERFNFATAESDYEECGAFHNAQRNQAWYAQWNTANPNSPLNLYQDGTTIRARVTAISFFQRGSGITDLAHVRYTKTRRTTDSGEPQITHWIATIQYAYGDPPKEPKIRRWNPLGFRVLDFQSEPEVSATP